MTTSDEQIGANVRAYRSMARLSQAELAELLGQAGAKGFHPQTITKIEKGDRSLKFSEAALLAAVLNVPLADLWDADMPSEGDLELGRALGALRGAADDIAEAISSHLYFAVEVSMALDRKDVSETARTAAADKIRRNSIGAAFRSAVEDLPETQRQALVDAIIRELQQDFGAAVPAADSKEASMIRHPSRGWGRLAHGEHQEA